MISLTCSFLLFWILSNAKAGKAEKDPTGFVVEYFSSQTVRMVTSASCEGPEFQLQLLKKFSAARIAFDWADAKKLEERDAVKRFRSEFFRLGALIDLKCPGSLRLLKWANKFDSSSPSRSALTFWMILTPDHVSFRNLELSAKAHAPKVAEPIEFLMEPYEDKTKEKYLMEINRKVNCEFFLRNRGKNDFPSERSGTNGTIIDELMKVNFLLDDKAALAVPVLGTGKDNDASHDLYRIYKVSPETRPKVRRLGRVKSSGRMESNGKIDDRSWNVRNFDGCLLRAVSTIIDPEKFTALDDVSSRERDLWTKMTYPHVKLLAEDLNFRIIIKFFDNYGSQTNGTFGHLIGALQNKKADISATGLWMRPDRFPYVEYLNCPFRMQTGILFKEPSLASVNNIFLLPFSKGIWTSIGVVAFLAATALCCRGIACKNLASPDRCVSSFQDVFYYVLGAVCQQGSSRTPESPTARITVLILSLASSALFASYSACIVALLQSSSSAISSLGDLTESKLQVGIQNNFPPYKQILGDEVDPVLKKFFERKILKKGDDVYCEARQGIEKMRTGMFAFEVELNAGFKVISDTYEEIEKCGIKEIDLFPKPFVCVAIRKYSPYREIFARRSVWQEETGLFDRSWKLWADRKPKCDMGRIGFVSIDLSQFRPALEILAYGILGAFLVLLAELFKKNF